MCSNNLNIFLKVQFLPKQIPYFENELNVMIFKADCSPGFTFCASCFLFYVYLKIPKLCRSVHVAISAGYSHILHPCAWCCGASE
ncbi:hypothetical protein FKM82_025726 [Ascaphus truei]